MQCCRIALDQRVGMVIEDAIDRTENIIGTFTSILTSMYKPKQAWFFFYCTCLA